MVAFLGRVAGSWWSYETLIRCDRGHGVKTAVHPFRVSASSLEGKSDRFLETNPCRRVLNFIEIEDDKKMESTT